MTFKHLERLYLQGKYSKNVLKDIIPMQYISRKKRYGAPFVGHHCRILTSGERSRKEKLVRNHI
jgi:hypothetical protein